ncbi:MAG: ral secretion pathway protein [Akkermansiaceae bacterium]|nr:ral secretion pathway protein [Akkermansiaceae bacterium]
MSLPLAQKHLFYAELAKLLSAGFPIRDAAAAMKDTRLPRQQTAILDEMEVGLGEGKSIADSFAGGSGQVSDLEKSIIGAGERGGRLAPAFQHLADYYGLLAESRKQAVQSMAYPFLLLNFGVIVGALIPGLSSGASSAEMLGHIGMNLGLLYLGLTVVGLLVAFLLKTALNNSTVDSLLNSVPLVGSARRNMAMARFTKVYHVCILAGLSISESARTASTASQSGKIRAAGKQLAITAEAGDRLGPLFISSGAFPKAFARSYSTAEESGGLDKDLARWAGVYQENASQSTKLLATAVPKLVYLLVMVYIAYQIISFYMGQYGEVSNTLDNL